MISLVPRYLLPHPAVIGALVLSFLVPLSACANPVPTRVFDEMNSVPFDVLHGGAPGDSAQFVRQLVQYGLDQPLLYRRATRVLIDSNFEKFKPLMLASQQPGQGLDAGIQARFRSKGSLADGIAMREALRGWLSAPVDVLLPAVILYRLNETSAQRAGELRSRAAEFLADWGDETALPAIHALAADTSLSVGARASLLVSAARLKDPCRSSFLVPDGHGGLRTCRSFSEVVRLRIIPGAGGAECAKDLDQAERKRLWDLLVGSREGPHARWFEGDGSLEIVFHDGLQVTIQTNEDLGLTYTDTGLPAGRSRTLENRPFFEAVSDCMPRRELPKLLGYGN